MQASRAWPFLVLLGACAEPARMLGPTTYVVAGSWRFDQTLENTAAAVTCVTYGPITVTQTGPRFTAAGTQSGYCAGPGGTAGITDEPFAMTNGTIDGTTIAFSDDECRYTGTAHGALPDSVTGTASCRIDIGSGFVTLSGTWRVKPPPDEAAPAVNGTTFGGGANGTFELGDDTVHVRLQATDNFALRAVGYELRGVSIGIPVVHRDSVLLAANDVATLVDTLSFPLPLSLANLVPPNYPNPMTLTGSVFAIDTAGNYGGTSLMPFDIHHPDPPIVTGAITGSSRPDTAAALRDTLDITVTASAPRALRYIGYRVTTFANVGDSIAITDTAATRTFRLPIPFAWKSVLLRIEIFTRDRLGLQDQEQVAEFRVAVLPSRPTQSLPLGQGVSDLVYDDVRRRIYLMTALDSTPQAGRPEVRVYDFASGGFLAGIALPWFADGMDLSPGGDSLLFTWYNGRLGIVNLTTLSQDSTDVIAFPPASGRYPFKVRALANGKAIVAIAGGFGGAPGLVVSYDLSTGTQTLRTDVGSGGDIGSTPQLGRAADRSRLVLFPSHPTASQVELYQSGTDAFGAPVAISAPPGGRVGISASGDLARWLVGNQLLDGALAPLRQLGIGLHAGTSVISADGVYAYVSVPEGVAKFRTTDGMQMELILLQDPPYILSITPDGNTLIALGFGLQLVDLR